MKKSCKQCGGEFEIKDLDNVLYRQVSPKIGGIRYEILLPDLCIDCRQQKRLAFRNEKTLYKRECDLCSKNIVTTYHPDAPYKVYCQKCFWSDKWDAKDFSQEYDLDGAFFEQFGELMLKVPRLALVNKQSENSEYCNYSFANKNCYLTFGNHYEEDCMYGRYSTKNKDCLDYLWLYGSELCYECIFSKNCYQSMHLDHCENCSDCFFCYDLKGCKDCIFSHGLRNKQYYVFNEPYTEEEYNEYISKLHFHSYKQFKGLKEGWEKYKKEKAIFKENYQVNCENCDGNNLQNSKNLKYCFSCSYCEDSAYGFQMDETYSSIDNSHMGYDRCEACYNCIGCSGIYNCICCDSCWHNSNLCYSNICFSSKNLFGCVGMRHDEYCVLNRQYSKEKYEEIVKKIIEQMIKAEEWGNFFPNEIYPFAYNESVVIEYYPIKEKEVLGKGWKWRDDPGLDVGGGDVVEISDSIGDVKENICDKVLKCEVTGKSYKILPKELEFYKKIKTIPRRCPDQRQMDRLKLANPWKLWERFCDQCSKKISSTFSPDRPEKVYCEECYLKEIF